MTPVVWYAFLTRDGNDVYSTKATLESDLQLVGIELSTAQLTTLSQIQTALNAGNRALAVSLIPTLSAGIPPINEGTARALFDGSIDARFEVRCDRAASERIGHNELDLKSFRSLQ